MGYTHDAWRPAPGTKTGRVWEIADELEARHGRLPRVSEVAAAYAAEGGHPGTGQVQFYAWKNARGRRRPPEAGPMPESGGAPPPPAGAAGATWLRVDPEGVLVLQPDLVEALRLDASRMVQARVEDGELRLSSVPVARERLRALLRARDTGGGSVVDELIRDRRAEAAWE